MQRLLIIGCGDVARRALPQLLKRYRVYALVRTLDPALRSLGVTQVQGDLDQPATLKRLGGLADVVLHSAPPADSDVARDRRTEHLLAALQSGKSLPRRLVYISTSGVYGNCDGAEVSEVRPPNPESARAARRVAAERLLREFGQRHRIHVTLLRAPGIYAADRLPLERVKRGDPVLHAAEDSYSNHIHADDLAAACVLALNRGLPNRAYNVSDDSNMKMGDWFTTLASAFDLPAPPRVDRAEAEARLSPALLSFLRESRRLDNQRVKDELGLKLRYPTVESGIAAAVSSGKETLASATIAVAQTTELPDAAPSPAKPKKPAKATSSSKDKSGKKGKKGSLKKPRRAEIQLPLF